jgi:UDP-GlcNAc:undecaprenyl-phosphate GlcNAc-1-phosphate transferase
MLSALALKGSTQKAPTVIAVAIPVVSFGLPILETTLSILRRLIAGKPLFTADREHIHHKLLARGMSHRQVVIVLYAVSAVFALLSLFLLWPTGSTLGLVLAVLGIGIWMGVQHLGYLEFGEIRRVAQRTIKQRGVFVNNLSIRKATEELKAISDYRQICRALEAAFSSNDFDGFDLHVNLPTEGYGLRHSHHRTQGLDWVEFNWKRPGQTVSLDEWSAWRLTLDLVAANNRSYGSLEVYRFYSERPLLVDINLLTSVFPAVLADALRRMFVESEPIPEMQMTPQFTAAEAG